MSILDHTIAEYVESTASLVFLMIDAKGRVLKSNRYARDLVGEDLSGQTFHEIIVDFTGTIDLKSLITDPTKPHLFNVRTAGGLPQTFYFRFVPIGAKILAIGEANRLEFETLRKCLVEANNDLSNLNRELQKKVAEQNRANQQIRSLLTEKQQSNEKLRKEIQEREKIESALRQSQKMQAIGTLAGGIAHDFNNILAAIIGFTEMAIEDLPDQLLVENNLKKVISSAVRARELVKQILAFSRKTRHVRSPIAVSSVVKETVQLLRASIPSTIDVKVAVAAAADTVIASPVEIQQIIMNLGTNALLSMEDQKGLLEVTLIETDLEPSVFDRTSPGHLQIMVRDTGIGMTPEIMTRIFEPFFTTREVGKGYGMGLAVIYGIIRDLGGTITVESKPGEGSTFRVFLPKANVAIEQDVKRSEIPRGTERVLFVDDEPLIIEWGKNTLERLGYTVTTALNGAKALNIFSDDPSQFDLVITDQAMPMMPGSELSGKLLSIRGDIPIILSTGNSESVSPENAKNMGIRGFLMKPLTRQELASTVRKVLDAA